MVEFTDLAFFFAAMDLVVVKVFSSVDSDDLKLQKEKGVQLSHMGRPSMKAHRLQSYIPIQYISSLLTCERL